MANIFYYIVIAIIFSIALFTVNKLIEKYKHKIIKKVNLSNYECGIINNDSPYYIYKFNFFLIAIIFLIFEIEIVFILPFITIFNNKEFYSLDYSFQNLIFFEMLTFIIILALGLIYAIKKKYLRIIIRQ